MVFRWLCDCIDIALWHSIQNQFDMSDRPCCFYALSHTHKHNFDRLILCLSSNLCQFAPWQSTAPALDALQTAPRGDTTTGVYPPAKNSGPERPPETLGCEKALHAFLSSHLKIHPPGLKMITTVHIKGCLTADASSTLPEVDLLEFKLQCIIMLGWARFKCCWRE